MINLSDYKTQMIALRKEYDEKTRSMFHQGVRVLFETWPKLESVSLKAFTPYFNDGDTCYYIVHKHDLYIVYDGQDYDYMGFSEDEPGETPFEELGPALQTFINAFDNHTYMGLFGDDVQITLTKDGVKTQPYEDHD